jgi:PAS domain S-box-containing protein
MDRDATQVKESHPAGFQHARSLPQSTRSVLLFTTAAFVSLMMIAVVALFVLSREIDAGRVARLDVAHTRDQIEQLQLVLSTLQDAETSERGFVITGNPEFLQPYEDARRLLAGRLDRLLQLTPASERASIETLSEMARVQMAFFQQVIAVRREQGEPAAAALVDQGTGKRGMDGIRSQAAAVREREEQRLARRNADVQHRSQRTEVSTQAGVSVAIALVALAGLFLLRHLRRRRRAERQAQAAFDVLRATLDSVNQGICVLDAQRRLSAWNDRFAELRGFDVGSLRLGMTLAELSDVSATLDVPVAEASAGKMAPIDMIREGLPFDIERTRRNGVSLQIRGRAMARDNYILTVSDVTAIRTSEANYRDQAVRLASILDNVVDAIVTINESGSIESWSKGAERLLGYNTDEVLRRNVSMLMPEPHFSAHDGYIRRYMATGERRIMGMRRELEALHKDGYRVPIDLGVSEMRIGKRRLFIGVLRDISDRREIERLKSGFVSTVSHELRTPLTSISGSLGLLAGGVAGDMPAKAKRLIDIAKVNCERLVRLINDILDLEKAESGRLEFHLELQALRPIVEQVIESMRAFADQFRVRIELDPVSPDAHVLVDRDRLIQVLTNLVSNACKFSPPGSTIELTIRIDIDSVQVLVKDCGPGIPKEFRPRMFQRFAQADSSDSRAKGGTGLGLSIAKTILERLGGNISFDSVEGNGTTFYVSLPLRQPTAQAAAMPSAGEPVLADGASVLVCEDDPDVAVVLCEMLRKEGMRVHSVCTARAAKSALVATPYDVAIVDLHLPDMEGIDLIAELRAEPATRALPVIVITAAATTGTEAEILSVLHLADWLQKPIDPQRLLRSIQHALLTTPRGRARVLHIEDDVPLTLLLRELLSDEADVIAAHSIAEAQQRIQGQPFDLIILDVSLADGSGLEVLGTLRQTGSGAPPVILYSATEPSREISQLVQGALVKSSDSVDQLLTSVRALTRSREREIVDTATAAE